MTSDTIVSYQDLFLAVLSGDPARVTSALEHANPNETDLLGQTPLWYALHLDHQAETIIRLLVARGASVDKLVNSRHLVDIAMARRAPLTARLLLDLGARLDCVGSSHALAMAVSSLDVEFTEILLKAGANAQSISATNQPLLEAIMQEARLDRAEQASSIASLLFKHGAPVDKIIHDRCAFDISPQFTRLLREQPFLDFLFHGETPLIKCTRHAKQQETIFYVKRLIECGANINAQSTSGQTALHTALWSSDVKTALWLLDTGASPSLQDSYETAPLHIAAQLGLTLVAQRLFELEPSADPVMLGGLSPLALAVKYRQYDMMKLLMSLGANVDHQDDEQNSILHIACHHADLFACRLLLDKGALVGQVNSYDQTPLDIARASGFCGLARFLVENGARAPFEAFPRIDSHVSSYRRICLLSRMTA